MIPSTTVFSNLDLGQSIISGKAFLVQGVKDTIELIFSPDIEEMLDDELLRTILKKIPFLSLQLIDYFDFTKYSKLSLGAVYLLLACCPNLERKFFEKGSAMRYLMRFEKTALSEGSERVISHVLSLGLSRCTYDNEVEEQLCSVNSLFFDDFSVGKFSSFKRHLGFFGERYLRRSIEELDNTIQRASCGKTQKERTAIILDYFSLFSERLFETGFPCYGIFRLIEKASFSSWNFSDEREALESSRTFLEALSLLDPTDTSIVCMLGMCVKAVGKGEASYNQAVNSFKWLLSCDKNVIDTAMLTSLSAELLQTGVKGFPKDLEKVKSLLEREIDRFPEGATICRITRAQLLLEENKSSSLSDAYQSLLPALTGRGSCIQNHYFHLLVLMGKLLGKELPEMDLLRSQILEDLENKDQFLKGVITRLLFTIYETSLIRCIDNFEEFKEVIKEKKGRDRILLASRATPFYRIALMATKMVEVLERRGPSITPSSFQLREQLFA